MRFLPVLSMTSDTDRSMRRSVALVLRAQVLMAVALVVGALLWSQPSAAFAGGFGSALGILGTIVSARSVRRASRSGRAGPIVSLTPVFVGEFQKLLIVGVGVAVGLAVLELRALFLLSGLILSQFGYIVASMLSAGGDR
ncbi:MAG: ATP synthase subunit I [Proteobacteria bacterium]|nr:MAG: ATP synthase subunit I [Pseudomonadota bacterium]